MSAEAIAAKLWNLCNVLRDDGVTYHQYLNELTFLLFLKLSEVKSFEKDIPEKYRWKTLLRDAQGGNLDNQIRYDHYRDLLANIATEANNESIIEIFTNASSMLRKPVNLETLVKAIDTIDWTEEEEQDRIATIYEELLEKNAGEKKSGAGQYFTPRPLINIMVALLAPKIGERWNDPAAGTFGFLISANEYLKKKTDDYFELDDKARKFQVEEAFTGCELVQDAHRLALMNAKLHGLESRIALADTLSTEGKDMNGYDGVLANPPFGTKKGGERPSRDDFTFPTSNKQLNFLQHIYRSLHKRGGARAAVVLPDNVLFDDNDGVKIRRDLMDKCNLHTVLRLPTGIFYAQGVKTNVLFFERGTSETGNTQNVWFYDMRTDVPSWGKRTPFTRSAFTDFVHAYTGGHALNTLTETYNGTVSNAEREKVADKRWRKLSREEIAAKGDSLDLGLLSGDDNSESEPLPEPLELLQDAQSDLSAITDELNQLIKLLG